MGDGGQGENAHALFDPWSEYHLRAHREARCNGCPAHRHWAQHGLFQSALCNGPIHWHHRFEEEEEELVVVALAQMVAVNFDEMPRQERSAWQGA